MLGTVHARLALWMLVGSAPLSLVGVEVANSVGANSMDTLETARRGRLDRRRARLPREDVRHGHGSDAPFTFRLATRLIAVVIGATCGFVVGLTSVGSGTFFGLAMLFVYPLTAKKIVGTDMFHAAILLWVAGISHLLHGDVDKHAIAWLLVGSIPGVLHRLPLSVRVPSPAPDRLRPGADPLGDQGRRGCRRPRS